MALISRWEISNFLSSGGPNRWNPDFIGEVYDFGGMSAAVVADNGVGKTSTVEAVLALLSNDQTLTRRTRSKAAPESYGFYSHIRVEFVLPEAEDPRQIAMPVGERAAGEYWVVGMYLYRSERPVRYHYQGTLEDIPVHEEYVDDDGGIAKAPRDDQDFTQQLPKDALFRTVQDWFNFLCPTFMSRHQLNQLVEYQKRGGGDKAASFYNVKVRPGGETFDQAFFRQIIAPELLTGIMEADTGDGTSEPAPIETGVVQQTNAVISAKLATERKHQRVEELAATLQHLDQLKEQAEAYIARRDEYDARYRESQHQLALLHALVNVWQLPGVPLSIEHQISGLTQQENADLQAIAYLPEGGMAVSQRWIRRCAPAAYKRISNGSQAEKPLPFAIDRPGTREGTTARISGYYPIETVRDLIAEAESNADALNGRLEAARRNAVENAHATRAAMERAWEEVRRIDAQITEKDTERQETQKQENELLRTVRNMRTGEQAYARLEASGHFSADDLRDPAALKQSLQQEQDAASQALSQHQQERSRLQERSKTLKSVQEAFGERAPTDVRDAFNKAVESATQASADAEQARHDQASALKGLRDEQSERQSRQSAAIRERDTLATNGQSLDRLEEHYGENIDPAEVERRIQEEGSAARQAYDAARKALDELNKSRGEATRERDRHAETRAHTVQARDDLAEHEPAARAFAERFPERTPTTFEADLKRERERLSEQISTLERDASTQEALVNKLADFRARTHAEDPADWIVQANRRREELRNQRDELATRLDEIDADLKTLETDQVAPTRLDRQARNALGEHLGAAPKLHEAIDAAGPDAARRADLLSHFAAVLFAPVYQSEDDAREAARTLGQHRLPVPVFLEADVHAWARGEQLALERREGLVRGVFAGTPTRPVEVLLDPELVKRERDELQAERTRLARRLEEEIEPELTRLHPEGELLKLAREAARAINEQAEARLATARQQIDELRQQDAGLKVLQRDDEARELARSAARFEQKGGVDELRRLRDRMRELDADIDRLHGVIADLDRRIQTAEEDLAAAAKRRDAALQAETFLSDCARAKEFVAAGGREKLVGLRRELQAIETRLGELADEIRTAEEALSELARTAEQRSQEKATAERQEAEWRQTLSGAIAFIEEGGPEFLASAEQQEADLKNRIERAGAKLDYNFDDAAQFVRAGGTEGLSEQTREIERLQAKAAALESDVEALQQKRPDRARNANQLAQVCREVETAIVTIVATYDKAVTILSSTGLDTINVDSLDTTNEAEMVMQARDAIAHGRMTQNDLTMPYMGLRNSVEQFDISNIRQDLNAKRDARDREKKSLDGQFRTLLGPGVVLASGLRERLKEAQQKPEQVAEIHGKVHQSHDRESRLLEETRAREEESREELSKLLVHLAGHAAFNLQTMKRVLSGSEGATFEIEASAADQDEIGRIMENVISLVEARRKRHDAEAGAAGDDSDENGFQLQLEGSVRDLINARMFPGARVKVNHPQIRNGHPFYFNNEDISGGQATALMLMWTIKLAAFSIARDARSLSGAARRRMRRLSHSIIIVDGLFSDLSEPNLIRESMNAMKSVRGHFQLIGLIHSPHYRNDWELFPTCIEARKMVSASNDGESDKIVAVWANRQDDTGRVNIANHRARSTLRAAE